MSKYFKEGCPSPGDLGPQDCPPRNRWIGVNDNFNERQLVSSWWQELIATHGTLVSYYRYNYSLSGHDFLYGEEPTAAYSPPVSFLMFVDIPTDSLLLSKFGIDTNADLIGLIHIEDFENTFGQNAEPLSKDLIDLTELGWTRPGACNPYPGLTDEGQAILDSLSGCTDAALCARIEVADMYGLIPPASADPQDFIEGTDCDNFRGSKLYEITERRDENVAEGINMLQGHYVWTIHAKRYDFSWEPGIDPEYGSDPVTDETLAGRLSGGANPPADPKPYDDNINNESDTVWDYDSDDNAYGGYGPGPAG
jgi:hypothetical protein